MLIVFDWDGTLADSRQHIVAAMQCAIDELQLPVVADDACASKIGLGLKEAAQSLFPEINDTLAEKFCSVYSNHFLQLGKEAYRLELFDGVVETLEALANNAQDAAGIVTANEGTKERGRNDRRYQLRSADGSARRCQRVRGKLWGARCWRAGSIPAGCYTG